MGNKRLYFVKCEQCGGREFTLTYPITKTDDDTWEDIQLNELFCHDGYGWELDRFTLKCIKCGSIEAEVDHEEVT